MWLLINKESGIDSFAEKKESWLSFSMESVLIPYFYFFFQCVVFSFYAFSASSF